VKYVTKEESNFSLTESLQPYRLVTLYPLKAPLDPTIRKAVKDIASARWRMYGIGEPLAGNKPRVVTFGRSAKSYKHVEELGKELQDMSRDEWPEDRESLKFSLGKLLRRLTDSIILMEQNVKDEIQAREERRIKKDGEFQNVYLTGNDERGPDDSEKVPLMNGTQAGA